MAKFIRYEFPSGEVLIPVVIACKTQAEYDANYSIAEKEAAGAITVDGEFEPEPDNASTDDVLNVLLGVT